MSSILSDPKIFVAGLILVGLVLAAGIYVLYRRRLRSIRSARAAGFPGEPPETESPVAPDDAQTTAGPPRAVEGPRFTTFQKRSGLAADLARALLLVSSLAVAAALILVLLPQPAMDRMVGSLEARRRTANPEKIAFLYLGDAIIDSRFHIRGVIRNITADPIERLDAVVRFYARDRSLLETTVVRMNRETIGPSEIARFELVYPRERLDFAGYSAEFKLRQGAIVPYRDMRSLPVQSK